MLDDDTELRHRLGFGEDNKWLLLNDDHLVVESYKLEPELCDGDCRGIDSRSKSWRSMGDNGLDMVISSKFETA